MASTPHQAIPSVSMPADEEEPGMCAPAVNRMPRVGNYCSDRGDGAAGGKEM
jgi:hypothetical protein